MAQTKAYAGGRFAMTVGGQTCGFIKKVDIGALTADINELQQTSHNIVKKHATNMKWEAWSIDVALGMGKGLYDWLRSAINANGVPMSGELIMADFDYKAQRSIQFFDALITEISFPALKGSDKAAPYLSIKFQPQYCRWQPGDGKSITALIGPKTKGYAVSNFIVDISGLTDPCKHIAEVGALKFDCKVVQDQVGSAIETPWSYASIARPDLDIKVGSNHAKPFDDAAKAWFVDGKRAESDERTGSITWLGPDMKEELASITMKNVGFKQYKMSAAEADSSSGINYANAIFYVEDYLFEIKKFDA